MNIIKRISSEIRCANKTRMLIFAALSLLAGTVSALLGGSSVFYTYINLPRSAPDRLFFIVTLTVAYLLVGAGISLILSCGERSKELYKYKCLLFGAIGYGFNLVWYPMFFSGKALLLSFIDAALLCAANFFTALYARKVSITAFLIFSAYFLFTFYLFVLNFIIFTLN